MICSTFAPLQFSERRGSTTEELRQSILQSRLCSYICSPVRFSYMCNPVRLLVLSVPFVLPYLQSRFVFPYLHSRVRNLVCVSFTVVLFGAIRHTMPGR